MRKGTCDAHRATWEKLPNRPAGSRFRLSRPNSFPDGMAPYCALLSMSLLKFQPSRPRYMSFFSMLKSLIRIGSLHIVDARGRSHVFRGKGEGPSVKIRLLDARLHWLLFVNPQLHLGIGYMNGTVVVEDGTVYDLLELLGRNLKALQLRIPMLGGLRFAINLMKKLDQLNPISRSYRNAAHHYNISKELFRLFLDKDMQYSCAYFPTGKEDIDTAQELKKRHIASKLLVKPGHKILDIGSGWGGLAMHLVREHGADVTGITLSDEQLKHSRERCAAEGLDKSLRFELRDYRELHGKFDRIVSVGMFEHVGARDYRTFFRCLRSLLDKGGVALLHTIGHMEPPAQTNEWIRRHIFPGGYIPALSEVVKAIEKEQLWITDIETWRLHYAKTLRCWKKQFQAERDKARLIYDEEFCRMWEFYLALSEVSFRHLGNTVYQIQLAKEQGAVPLTRNYLFTGDGQLQRK